MLDGKVDARRLTEAKISGQNADDGATDGVEGQRPAEDVRVGAEPPFPEAVSEHHRTRGALEIFLWQKIAPEEWGDPEDGEEARRD